MSMDQMIKKNSDKALAVFYDLLSSNYDQMTGFFNRFNKEQSFFISLIKQYNIRTALDAGCGTGFHALLLSQSGVDITAIDISDEMLRTLKRHAREMNQEIKTRNCRFTDLRKELDTTFDAVFCMGNSLAHILTQKELRKCIDNFHEILNPNGILVLQLLNYDRILKMKERIISVKEIGRKLFIRFYDFLPKNIVFNILTVEKNTDAPNHHLQSIELRPIRPKELVATLRQSGFTSLHLYGNIRLDKFSPATSTDLIIIATK
jgi:glycine/sarcosine N-methyltransferase